MADAPGRPRKFLAWIMVVAVVLVVSVLIVWAASPGPANHWSKVTRARNLLARGRPEQALEALSAIRDDKPGAAEGLALAARALLMKGNISTARRALERSLTLQPAQPEASKMLAAIYLASGDGARGIDQLQKATRYDPRDFRPWFAMGKAYHDLGDFTKSADCYREALRRSPPDPDDEECRIGLIRALLDATRTQEATGVVAEALARSPANARVLGLAARHSRDLGRNSEASSLASRALAVDRDNFDALLVEAQLSARANDLDRANQALDRALAVNPNHLGALQLLLQVQSRRGRAVEVASTKDRFLKTQERVQLMDRLTREITRRPNDPEPRLKMGRAAVEGNMQTLARQCFQAALDIDPTCKPAIDALRALPRDEPASRVSNRSSSRH